MKDLFERHGERLTERERAEVWESIEAARRRGARRGARAWRPAAAAALALVLVGGVLLVARWRESKGRGVGDLAANRIDRSEQGVTDGGAPVEMPSREGALDRSVARPQEEKILMKSGPETERETAAKIDDGRDMPGAHASGERLRSLGYAEGPSGDEAAETRSAGRARDAAREREEVASAPSAAAPEFAERKIAAQKSVEKESVEQERAEGAEVAGAAGTPAETTTLASTAPASSATDVKYEFKHRALSTVQDALSKEPGVVEADGQLFVRGGRADETKYFGEGMSTEDLLGWSSRASYDEARRAIEGGRLPAADSIRVHEFVNAFPDPDGATAGNAAIVLEGAPRPFPALGEPGHVIRIVRVAVRTPGPSSRLQASAPSPAFDGVEFDTTVVKRLDLIAGPSGVIDLLYHVELAEGVSAGTIATVETRPAPASEGEAAGHPAETRIDVSDLAPSFDAASPRFRLAALAAEFGEVLQRADATTATRLADLVPHARRVAAELAGDPAAAEFARLVERSAEIARMAPPAER